jgi:flagellar hook-associated protein 2
MQSATNAVIGFNGLTITRSSNTINDVVAGAVLSINQVTETGGTSNPARVTISSDTSTLKTKVQSLVTEYNNFNGLMAELGSSATDEDNEMMGALRRDTATVRYIQNALRTAVLANSSTTATGVEGLRDIGVSMDKSGNLTFDEKKYDTAITTSFDKVVTMLTADTTNQSEYSTAAKGLSQDIAKVLDGLGDTDSVLSTRNTNAETAIETYEEELADLEKRMEAVYDRYLSQFSAMESMMNSMNGTKDYLEGQLESLSKAYDK